MQYCNIPNLKENFVKSKINYRKTTIVWKHVKTSDIVNICCWKKCASYKKMYKITDRFT